MKMRFFVPALLAMNGFLHGEVSQGDVFFMPDPKLGLPFQVHYFDVGEEKYRATLIDYPWDHETAPKASVLYIHGFNDYFFQKELAQKVDSAGYSFYAIDLHKYGRSYRPDERLGEVYDLAEYFQEIDTALAKIKAKDNAPLVILGHSTGGLIAALYAQKRDNGKNIAAMVLNSPFMDMNVNFLMELTIPLVAKVGQFFPDLDIPRGTNTCYSESIHKNYGGQWDFDTRLKTYESLPINMGWLNAIHQGHVAVQKGMDLETPILVMHSDCSVREEMCIDEYNHCDGVLDVEDIDRYGRTLGKNVQMKVIEGGLHDLYLSHEEARHNAYQATFKFLNENIK